MVEIGSRRAFIASAAVVGGVALIPWMGRRAASAGGSGNAVRVVPGAVPAATLSPTEAADWSALVGQPVRISGDTGPIDALIAAVEPGPADPRRPAGLRRQSFTVHFAVDRIAAPVRDGIYDMGRAVDGLSRLFLQRGEDRAGKAMLAALFN